VSEAWALALAVASVAGAIAGADGHLPVMPFGLLLTLAVVLVALAARRPAALCLGVALLAGVLGQRSMVGLASPPLAAPVRGEVTLVSDPEPDGRGAVAVDVRLGDRRVRAVARASGAAALDDRLAGERVTVVGRTGPPGPWERLLRHRHLAGRLTVETVTGWRPGGPATRVANGLRRTLVAGAGSLPPRQQSLLAGLTLGDDRAQPADLADAFEAAGLTHLLAVSGQNVAFVLVVASPVLSRLRFAPRLAATLAVLAGFALVTRFEPSVLRATAMAAVAAAGVATGRPASSRRALGLGVTAMVLVDPLLATSVGFQLSALATAGIVLLAAPVERSLPGPRWLTAPLSVTIAAQLAVSPLLVATFGPLPVASLPANLLAGPAAGPVMVWGLTAGLVAGVAGGPVAALLHLPTRVLLTWLEAVALTCARAPLGSLGAPHLAALAAALALLAATRRAAARVPVRPARGVLVLRLGAGLLLAGTLVAAASPRPPGTGPIELGVGATAWRGSEAVVLVADGRAHARPVLEGLRLAGARRLDAVVLRSNARSTAELVATLRRRWPGLGVVAPPPSPDGRGPPQGAVVPDAATTLTVGDVVVELTPAPGRLGATVSGEGVAQRPSGSGVRQSPTVRASSQGSQGMG
jgi:competence protein ComEC